MATHPVAQKSIPELWGHMCSFLGGPIVISKTSASGAKIFQEYVYKEVLSYYSQEGGEAYVHAHFSLSYGQSLGKKLELIFTQIRACHLPRYKGIGVMGARVLSHYEEGLKALRLESWKRMKGGYRYVLKHSPKLLLRPGLEFGRAYREWIRRHPYATRRVTRFRRVTFRFDDDSREVYLWVVRYRTQLSG